MFVDTEMASADLVCLVYPLHCRIAAALEDTIRGDLTPVQGSILWMFRPYIAAGQHQPILPRKEIAQWVKRWFGITSAAVSHAIHGMVSPPLALVKLVGDPSSRREKRVCLTSRGERFLTAMERRGRLSLELVQRELSDEQVRAAVNCLRAFALAAGKIDAQDEADKDTVEKRTRTPGFSGRHIAEGRLLRSISRKRPPRFRIAESSSVE